MLEVTALRTRHAGKPWRERMLAAEFKITRSDPYINPEGEGKLDFRLTYAGELLAHRDDGRLTERSLHVHKIRREFQKQLRVLWTEHPVLKARFQHWHHHGFLEREIFAHDGFHWLPMVTEANGLICKLEILMLRSGAPGRVLYDLDNRLKTIFDALRKAKGPQELGSNTSAGQQAPSGPEEDPFYVLSEDDRLITHVAVTSDTLLEPVPNVDPNTAVRLVINVTVRPYHAEMFNLEFA